MVKKKMFHHKSYISLESKLFGESNGAILKARSKVDIAKCIKTMRDEFSTVALMYWHLCWCMLTFFD